MEIRNLITFTKVAETQSLSKAARALGYAQSTVTMQMQQLEQELGLQLYERVGKQIRITQTGQEFLSYAMAIVRMSEEALMIGKQESAVVAGSLRLGILSSLSGGMSTSIARYLQKYPQVDLSVQTIPDPDSLLSALKHNDIDLALTLDLPRTDPDLIHAGEDRLVSLHIYAAKDHPLAGQRRLSAEALSPYPLICAGSFDAGSDYTPAESIPGQVQVSDPVLALSIAARTDGAKEHAAIVLAPDLLIHGHPDAEQLIQLDCDLHAPALCLQLLYHRNKWLTGAMKAWLSDSQKLSFFL